MIQSLVLKAIDIISVILLFINFHLFAFNQTTQNNKDEVKSMVSTEHKTDGDFKNIVHKRYNNAVKLYNAGNYKKSIEEFEDLNAIIELEPDMKKEYDSAKEYIAKSGEKLNDMINSHLNKAKQSKKLSEQLKELRSALNIDPELTAVKKLLKEIEAKVATEVSNLYFKGVDLYAADKLQEAIKIWKEALELKPDHARIKKDLARAESKLQLLNR